MTPYSETQRFNQWWIWAILFIPFFEILAVVLNDYQSMGDVRSGSLIALGVICLVVLLFLMMELTTNITDSGIQYRFFPFQLKHKTISWDQIESATLRTYSPLKEYGGWGVRISLKNGKALNVKGNIGLQLVLKDGSRILIGTGKEDTLKNYLQQLKQYASIAPIQ